MNNKRTRGFGSVTLLVIAIAMMAVLWYTSRFEGRDRDLTWD